MSNLSRVDLASLRDCDVLAIHRLPAVGQPGDRLECPEGHDLVTDSTGRWRRADV
jgi:hypothetical protein